MLLPALTKAKDRAKQIECAGQLKNIAVAFHSFAHDHNNQFPMQVPLAAGGSLASAPRGIAGPGEAAQAYLHFRALASELRTPRILICPADTRLPAPGFSGFSNQNLSYFASLNAEFGNANSLLAGDRNLTNDYAPLTSVQRLSPNISLRWSPELHRFRGNLLFSDGHVDQTGDAGLRVLNKGSGTAVYALNLPVPSGRPSPNSARVGGMVASVGSPAASPGPQPPSTPQESLGKSTDKTAPDTQVSTDRVTPKPTAPAPVSPVERPKEKPPVSTTLSNAPAITSPPTSETAEENWMDGVIRFLRKFLWAFYLGLLLLALLALLATKWRRKGKKERTEVRTARR